MLYVANSVSGSSSNFHELISFAPKTAVQVGMAALKTRISTVILVIIHTDYQPCQLNMILQFSCCMAHYTNISLISIC